MPKSCSVKKRAVGPKKRKEFYGNKKKTYPNVKKI